VEVTAIIVARKGSVRVKNKSMSLLGSETLIERKIRQLKNSKLVNRIVFGSNCDEMLSHAAIFGAEVIKREDYYCDESVCSANEMIGNMCDLIETDIVLWSHCTNPFIEGDLYDQAITQFLNSECDSLLSVVELREHLWAEGKPFNYNPYSGRHVPAKELQPLYMQDGGIFIQKWRDMKENRYFFGKNPSLFIINQDSFFDINTEKDLLMARGLISSGLYR